MLIDNLHNPPYLNIYGKRAVRISNTIDVTGNLEKGNIEEAISLSNINDTTCQRLGSLMPSTIC